MVLARSWCKCLLHRQWKNSGSKEFESGPAIHLPFDHFQAVYLTLDWPIAPSIGDRICHCLKVPLQLPYEFADRRDARPFRLFNPILKAGDSAVAQNATEGQYQVMHRGESGGPRMVKVLVRPR